MTQEVKETIDLEFGDGSYTFKFTLQGLKEIQEKSTAPSGDNGIGSVWRRLVSSRGERFGLDLGLPDDSRFRIEEIIEVIRQGLIGGGSGVVDGEEIKVTPAIANRLVETYVLNAPLEEGWKVAAAAMGACVQGWVSPDETKSKKKVSRQKKS